MDREYQCFCSTISTAAKKCIPRGRRNNRMPCWNAECENLYQTFLQYFEGHESSRVATALLDRKRRDRWSEAVQIIDFSHSSRAAWSILNNLTGRSRQSPRQCPVSANPIEAGKKTRNTRVQIKRFLNLLCRNCLTFGGLLLQMQ